MAAVLALDGGEPAVPPGMVQPWPPITQQDRDAVVAVLDSGHLHGTQAPRALELQEKWARYCGARYCLVVNSGTAACHMAVASVGVGPGDEVILPAFTYWASAAAVLHQNAIPVFVDIDPRASTIDPARIEAKITPRTRALFPVDVHGMPSDMDPILALGRRHGIPVISDCCQAHGARYKGRVVGSIADATAFSTNRSKNLSGGEGGLFTTDSEDAYRFAVGMMGFSGIPVNGPEGDYEAHGLGWGFRPHELVNALTLSQLARFDEHNALRREMAECLTLRLAEVPGVAGPYTPPYAQPSYFSYVVEFRPEELGLDISAGELKRAVVAALSAEGMRLGQWQTVPVPAHSVFQAKRGYGKGCPFNCPHAAPIDYRPEDYPETERFIAAHSYLAGVHPPNDMRLIDAYVAGFRKVMSRIDRVLEWARESRA